MSNHKLIYLIIICLFPLYSFSQEAVDVPVNNSRLYVGFTFSPDYAFRSLTIDSLWWGSAYMYYRRQEIEVPKLGFTTGINVAYQFSERFGIESGALFSNKGEKTVPFGTFVQTNDSFYFSTITIQYNYKYIDIPLKFKYNIMQREKMNLFVSPGVSANYFIAMHSVAQDEILNTRYRHKYESRGISSDFNKFNFAINLSAGMDYTLNDKLSLRIEPIYRSSLTPIMKAPIHQYLYSLGLNTGVFMKL